VKGAKVGIAAERIGMTADAAARELIISDGDTARRIAIVQRQGGAPGLMWLGGFRSDMGGTKALALDALGAELGLQVTRFDYSGHGASGGAFEDGTISRWLDEARAVFDTMTEGPQILVGSSMGGWIALLLARDMRARLGAASRIKGLVLIAPAPDFTEDLMWARLPEAAKAEIMATGRHEMPSAYAPEPYAITRGLIEDGRRHLLLNGPIELGAPVHILQGRRDPDVPWQHAERLMERLAHDDAVLTFIPEGDHRLSRPQDLALLERSVRRMLVESHR
jgi:pimeloyl-ACP methyl ester carboxylesterase